MSKRLFLVAAICCLFVPTVGFAQAKPDHGRILGAVFSSSVGPLIAADVTVRNQADSTVARAATAVDGRFFIDHVAFGTYTVRVSFVGYKTRILEGVVVSANARLVDLGAIGLDAVLIVQKEVKEVAQKK